MRPLLNPILPFTEGETPSSYVARLARLFTSTPRDFCSDLGMRWPHICSAHLDQLETLSLLTSVPLNTLDQGAARLIGPCRYLVGLSSATNGTLRRATIRICPRCIVEAMEASGPGSAFQLLEWLVLPIGTCAKHGVPLLQLPNAPHAHLTYDVIEQVARHRDLILEAAQVAKTHGRSSFETYLSRRIKNGVCGDWLDSLDLTHLHQAALTLGMTLAMDRGVSRSDLDFDLERAAMSAGFEVLKSGPENLKSELERARRRSSSKRSYFTTDMGEFYTWLKDTEEDPATAELRACVQEFVRENYPLQTGAKVLGTEISAPKLITLERVRELHGVGEVRVRGILAHLRGKNASDLSDMKDVSHEDLAAVLDFWSGLQNIKSTATQLNIHPVQVKSLIRQNVLEAHRFGTSLRYVSSSSVQTLLTQLEGLHVASPARHRLPLAEYCQQSWLPLARVVADWATGRLTGVSRDPDVDGLAGILIDYTETLEKPERVFSGDLSLKDAAARLRISVGSIRRLRDGGYLKQIKARNPDTQHYRCYITEESIQAFAEVYVTLGQMAEHIELAAIHLARALDRREIETIPCNAGFVRAYPKETKGIVRELANRVTS
ncbi:TniQ family protein [Ruegeria atlantica]|uniref:TniQ family protein n=1 Tax=Ruegeria atlantica TaxID=81569 RepID=UPI0024959545|nr:TniQ family protein [Ruegeria atlantica]